MNTQLTSAALRTLFERETTTGLDLSYIDSLKRRYYRQIKRLDIEPLAGVINLREFPKKYPIHPGEYWEVTRLQRRDNLQPAPVEVKKRLQIARDLRIPFEWFLWVEQYTTPPVIRYLPQETKYIVKDRIVRFRPDPALIGLIRCGKDMGIPYLIGCWKHE